MSDPILSIRWHSRAGQGAVTAASALAAILGALGRSVQSFPAFGAEKRGAPVVCFNRVSNSGAKIVDASQPTEVDAVVLLDPSLVVSGELPAAELTAGLKKGGFLLVNSAETKSEISAPKIFTIDASGIATAEIGRDIPNVAIFGALVSAAELANPDEVRPLLAQRLQKLPPEIVEGNLKAFDRGAAEVREIESCVENCVATEKNLPSWQELPVGAVLETKKNGSQNYRGGNWTHTAAVADREKCIGCRKCSLACPDGAISFDENGKAVVDPEICKSCEICVGECPVSCIEIRKK